MSDKQRQHHLNQYWNGPLTRAEAQKVFDETAGVIQKTQETLVKLDMVLAFLIEKSGATLDEVQTWMNERVKKIQAETAKQAEAEVMEAPKEPEPQGVVLA